jgi:hypothetical protein
MISVGAGGGLLLCVLSIPVGMTPRPTLGKVMPGRLKLGRNLLEAAARGPAAADNVGDVGVDAAGDVCAADGAKAAAAFYFKRDEKPAMSRAVSETGLVLSWVSGDGAQG